MNNAPHVTIIGWETRNWRHAKQALVHCKDYGFKPVTKHVFIGEVYSKERAEIRAKFKGLFTGKTERFFFAAMCRSCFSESMSGMRLKDDIRDRMPFELVQMPKKA